MSENTPCQNGAKCNYPFCKFLHPLQCKYGKRCYVFTKVNFMCNFRHLPDCQFGKFCYRQDCVFNHDIANCRYGQECYDISCSFQHPNNKKRLQHLDKIREKERRRGAANPVVIQCLLDAFPDRYKCIDDIFNDFDKK